MNDAVEKPLARPSSEELASYCSQELAACQKLLEDILRSDGARAKENTLVPLNRLHMQLSNVSRLMGLMRSVHPDAGSRAAAEKGEQEVSRFSNDLSLNRPLYEAVSSTATEDLDATGKRHLEHLLRDFHRAGVDRDEDTRTRIHALREELVTLGQTFARNILNDVKSITLKSKEDLDGLPEDYIRDHSAGADGEIRVTTDYPDYNPFMAYAHSGDLRRELYVKFRRRAYPANLEVLDKILAKRHELATLLGYQSWAAYIAEDKMIKTDKAIGEFLNLVSEISRACARRDYDVLLDQKRADDPATQEVFDWEKGYYAERVKSQGFQVDSKEVRPYFEYCRVKDGILALTENLFNVRFQPAADAPRWHEDVEVLDMLEEEKRVGRIYLDMHPREGKFKHAAMFPLVSGVRGASIPEAALVCNFPDPCRERQGPALLEHEDVVTFFHEFGHVLHHLFARDHEWAAFSGTATEWDFVEVPSQLYEEWAWDYQVLQRFATHYETEQPIPEDLVHRMRSARDFGRGLSALHQVFYAAFSLACYDRDPTGLDTNDLMQELQNQYSLFRFVEGTYFQTSFGHLDDYSALYYTYLWSLVVVKDIFQSFREGGTLSREIAQRYRERVLAPGGAKDAVELVRDFLGRDYTFEAFENWLNAN